MEYKRRGTGESYSQISHETAATLNNMEVTHTEMCEIMEKLPLYDGLKYRIFFGPTRKRLWGKCNYKTHEIIVNRPSVAVFLHEVAHMINYEKYGQHGHTPHFAQILDSLIVWHLNLKPTNCLVLKSKRRII